MTRVLLATTGYPPEHSGSGGRLHQLYTRLSREDPTLQWSVLTKRENDLPAPPGPRHVHSLPSHPRQGMRKYLAYWREMAAVRAMVDRGLLDDIDIVHSAGWSFFTFELCRLARRRRIPILREITALGEIGDGPSLGARLILRTNLLAQSMIAISPALAERAKAAGISVPIWCRPNGIDSSRFHLPSDDQRRLARRSFAQGFSELSDDSLIVLHVGRIRPLKNQLFLAECVARLPRRFHLMLAGPAYRDDDPYLTQLRQRIAQPDLASRVMLQVGQTEKVAALMHGSDLFALPSSEEGLGTVMLEALCCGLPVVANRIDGITDWIVTDGENGGLARLDLEDFSSVLMRATALAVRRREISATALDRFDHHAIDAAYLTVLHELARRRGC